mgnify:CR=1 FL=1
MIKKTPYRVLIVDDEPDERDLLAELLSGPNRAVEVRDTPRAALEFLQHNPVDLAFLDHHLPGMSGTELAQRIKTMYPHAHIVMCTGYLVEAGCPEILDRAEAEYAKGTPLQIIKYRTLWALLDPERTSKPDVPLEIDIGGMCSIGTDSLTVMPDGTVLPCRRLPIAIGNLQRDSLFKIWYTSDLLWKLRDKNNLQGKCNDCELIPRCGGCRAIAHAMTGNYLAEDPQCWK